MLGAKRAAWLLAAALLGGSACQFRPAGLAATTDGGPADGGAPPRKAELMSGAERLTAGSITMDAELGHAVTQRPVVGGGHTLQGGAAVIKR